MKRVLVLVTLILGCGGDEESPADARVIPGPDYDLSCLNFAPATAPDPVVLTGKLYDVTTATNAQTVGMAEIRVYTLDDTLVTTVTSSDLGELTMSLPTAGQPKRFKYAFEPAGMLKTRAYFNIGEWMSTDKANLLTFQQSRLDSLAAATGATLDPTKGALEVAIDDCSGSGFPGARVSIADEPQAAWAVFGGMGAWLTRSTTVAHAEGWPSSNIGTVNLTPGPKTLTVTSGSTTLGPVSFNIEADTYTTVVVLPGTPRL